VFEVAKSMVERRQQTSTRKFQAPQSADLTVKSGNINQMLALTEAERPPLKALFIALASFAAIDGMWILFFSLHPGEGKTVFQALYMSVITLSSVGFGWFTPVTEEGMIFAAYFMIFGCAALVNVITQFTELIVKLNEYEKHNFVFDSKLCFSYSLSFTMSSVNCVITFTKAAHPNIMK
jgi:hypothetical protein